MAAEGDKSNDFYAVLGLKKECTSTDLRNAYKKLALKWHPDRISASGNSKYVEEAKKKFQAIQQAYSVLSDVDKRFLYDVGVYDCNDDDDENGMGEFLNEMAAMMSQTKSNSDIDPFNGPCRSDTPQTCSSSSSETYNSISNKKHSIDMSSVNFRSETAQFDAFCIGTGGATSVKNNGGESSRRKNTRKSRR
ncbi:hypothetical protein DH2020_016299 [Rehmannia glutinosa]|uniref:J domain-containing protein n=1 Tax=Rehmannia glutinosa TaxID=99300 RepID=A0ABR0WRG7_REHGL